MTHQVPVYVELTHQFEELPFRPVISTNKIIIINLFIQVYLLSDKCAFKDIYGEKITIKLKLINYHWKLYLKHLFDWNLHTSIVISLRAIIRPSSGLSLI